MKIEPIDLLPSSAKLSDDNATPSEIAQLRSLVGSESWVARSCRPEYLYDVSILQQAQNKAKISDLLDANQLAKELQATPKRGLTSKPGLDWYNSILCVIGDSSFGNESEWIDEWQEFEPHRSQGGNILAITPPSWKMQPGMLHILSFGSTVVRRVRRSIGTGRSLQS